MQQTTDPVIDGYRKALSEIDADIDKEVNQIKKVELLDSWRRTASTLVYLLMNSKWMWLPNPNEVTQLYAESPMIPITPTILAPDEMLYRALEMMIMDGYHLEASGGTLEYRDHLMERLKLLMLPRDEYTETPKGWR